MDIVLIITGFLLIIIGFVGTIVPILPGTIACFAAVLLMHYAGLHHFSTTTMVLLSALTILTLAVDYIMPMVGTKKFGGTKFGVVGSTVGVFVSVFAVGWMGLFAIFGVMILSFVGALVGELIGRKTMEQALWSALGATLGFLISTLLKIGICVLMALVFLSGLSCYFKIESLCNYFVFL